MTIVGTTLGTYEIGALVGRGGMGEVYRARDSRLKRTVAIKITNHDSPFTYESRLKDRKSQIHSLVHGPIAGPPAREEL